VNIINLDIRVINPIPSVVTDYEFTFSADAEFLLSDMLLITFPSGINPWPTLPISRLLNTTVKCEPQITPWISITCSEQSSMSVLVKGLFVNNYGQYSVRVNSILNPNVTGPTDAFQL